MTVYVEGPIYQLSSRDDPFPAERTRPAELVRTGGPGTGSTHTTPLSSSNADSLPTRTDSFRLKAAI